MLFNTLNKSNNLQAKSFKYIQGNIVNLTLGTISLVESPYGHQLCFLFHAESTAEDSPIPIKIFTSVKLGVGTKLNKILSAILPNDPVLKTNSYDELEKCLEALNESGIKLTGEVVPQSNNRYHTVQIESLKLA